MVGLRLALMGRLGHLFQQSKASNSKKVKSEMWPSSFELIRDFISVLLICKFHKNLIDTSWTLPGTSLNLPVFSIQGQITLRLIVRSCQI